MSHSRTIPVFRLHSPQGRALLKRIASSRGSRNTRVDRIVSRVLAGVAKRGDAALFSYTRQFEERALSARSVRVSPAHIRARAEKASPALKNTIRRAATRIRAYHARQKKAGFTMRTAEGVLSLRVVPLARAGVYVPGGYTAYPSSVLMNVVPAQVAGVKEIAVVTPVTGRLDPAIAFALDLLGITEVYQIGGAQAVAALAYGTKSVRAVDKIVGPGNAFVAAAKRAVYGTVDIDSIAGPSEVAIIADTSAKAAWIALDMLAQAEHGTGDETAVCITESMTLARRVAAHLAEQITASPVRGMLRRLPGHALSVFVCDSRRESIELVNVLAPEHLQIMTRKSRDDAKKIHNSGAIFLGPHTPVALGDYYIGTNHVLPTGGTARFASGLGVDDFVKRISVAEVGKKGFRASAKYVSRFARAEGFVHHAMSVEERG
ncbi:MAG: histidinol dehydrogenase [Chitinivibrionales bacterium]|nr:histidinol dehydrogenase [Chitinivibrionales bacterium]MBD3396048.1 histidinol dehydrogenase [Chitinivibrionales bacterium]